MEKSFNTMASEAMGVVPSLMPLEAAALRGRDKVVFVDPRPAEAIAATTGRIPGALNIPLADIRAGRLPADLADQGLHVITSCQAGPMGALAAYEFAKLGFARVNYVEGGTQGWLDAGLSTTRQAG